MATSTVADPPVFCIEWNAENQLTRVTKNSVEHGRFRYDGVGRRVEKVAGGVTTTRPPGNHTYSCDPATGRSCRRGTTMLRAPYR